MDEQVKIWQRVRGSAPPITDGLPGLAAGALSRAMLYGALARQMQGPGRGLLQQLQEEEQYCARCLKGIYRLATGSPMNTAAVPAAPENAEAAIRRCYGQTLKALNAYNSRTSDAEYGIIFDALGVKMRANCCKLAELLSLF